MICIESNLQQTRILNSNLCLHSNTAQASSSTIPIKFSTTTPAPIIQTVNNSSSCGNCGHRYSTDKCFQPRGVMEGKRDKVLTSRPAQPQAHFAKIDEGIELEEEPKTDDGNVLTTEFATMSINHSNDIDFSTDTLSPITTTHDDIPLALASFSQSFNSVLNPACTTHIIRDHNLFHQYDADGGVPVKTANCGFLETLAISDVKLRMVLNKHTIV
jgi:hypothetical protein